MHNLHLAVWVSCQAFPYAVVFMLYVSHKPISTVFSPEGWGSSPAAPAHCAPGTLWPTLRTRSPPKCCLLSEPARSARWASALGEQALVRKEREGNYSRKLWAWEVNVTMTDCTRLETDSSWLSKDSTSSVVDSDFFSFIGNYRLCLRNTNQILLCT